MSRVVHNFTIIQSHLFTHSVIAWISVSSISKFFDWKIPLILFKTFPKVYHPDIIITIRQKESQALIFPFHDDISGRGLIPVKVQHYFLWWTWNPEMLIIGEVCLCSAVEVETCVEPGCSHLRWWPGESPRCSRHSLLDPRCWEGRDFSQTFGYTIIIILVPSSFIYWQRIRKHIR